MKAFVLPAAVAGLLTLGANAANVTWQSHQYISGSVDVDTSGSYFGSWAPYIEATGGGGPVTVNGVAFQGNDLPSFSINSWFGNLDTVFGSPGTSDTNYNTLLEGAQYSNDGTAGSFSWGGLTVGHTYLVQVWAEDLRTTADRKWENVYGDEGKSGQSQPLNFPANGNGNNGQYVIGTFVADSTGTQTLNFNTWSQPTAGGSINSDGTQRAQVNLFQVRDITPVPEPSALGLLAGGGLIMLGRLRRRA